MRCFSILSLLLGGLIGQPQTDAAEPVTVDQLQKAVFHRVPGKAGQGSCIATGQAGSWNSRFVGSPTVVHDDGTYWMWFNGGEVTADTSYPYKIIERIGGATSRDGVNWKPLNGGKPALRLGPKGSADHRGMAHPYVLKVGDRFLMWYGAIDGRSGTDLGIAPAHVRVEQICLASSRDGVHWKKENGGRPVMPLGKKGNQNFFKIKQR